MLKILYEGSVLGSAVRCRFEKRACAFLRELLGKTDLKHVISSERRYAWDLWIGVLSEGGTMSNGYYLVSRDSGNVSDFDFVGDVIEALSAPGVSSTDAWDAINYVQRREFFREALHLTEEVTCKDLIAAYNLAAEEGIPWESLLG